MVHPCQRLEFKGFTNRRNAKKNDTAHTKTHQKLWVAGILCSIFVASWTFHEKLFKKILNNRFFQQNISQKTIGGVFWFGFDLFFVVFMGVWYKPSTFFSPEKNEKKRPVPPKYDRMLGSDVKPSPGVAWDETPKNTEVTRYITKKVTLITRNSKKIISRKRLGFFSPLGKLLPFLILK